MTTQASGHRLKKFLDAKKFLGVAGHGGAHFLILAIGRLRWAELYEFEVNLLYKAGSRPGEAMVRPCLENKPSITILRHIS